MQTYVGIDPGKQGAIAVIDDIGKVVIMEKMPATEYDLLDLFKAVAATNPAFAFLELVHGRPTNGCKSNFLLGFNFGQCQMAMSAAKIRFGTVSPQRWKKMMGVLAPKVSQTVAKNVSKRAAQNLFPGMIVSHHVSEALLIAEYCRRLSMETT